MTTTSDVVARRVGAKRRILEVKPVLESFLDEMSLATDNLAKANLHQRVASHPEIVAAGLGLPEIASWFKRARQAARKKGVGSETSDVVPQVSGTSRYVGVVWNKQARKWKVQIAVNGALLHLGTFSNEEEAARKYDDHAALLNRPLNFAEVLAIPGQPAGAPIFKQAPPKSVRPTPPGFCSRPAELTSLTAAASSNNNEAWRESADSQHPFTLQTVAAAAAVKRAAATPMHAAVAQSPNALGGAGVEVGMSRLTDVAQTPQSCSRRAGTDTVKALRAKLKALGLPVSGPKAVLRQRLVEAEMSSAGNGNYDEGGGGRSIMNVDQRRDLSESRREDLGLGAVSGSSEGSGFCQRAAPLLQTEAGENGAGVVVGASAMWMGSTALRLLAPIFQAQLIDDLVEAVLPEEEPYEEPPRPSSPLNQDFPSSLGSLSPLHVMSPFVLPSPERIPGRSTAVSRALL